MAETVTLTALLQGGIPLSDVQKYNLLSILEKHLREPRRSEVKEKIMNSDQNKWPKCFWAFDHIIFVGNQVYYKALRHANKELVEARNHLMGWSR